MRKAHQGRILTQHQAGKFKDHSKKLIYFLNFITYTNFHDLAP